MRHSVTIRPALAHEMPLIVSLVRELAIYEHLEHEMVATAEDFAAALYGPQPSAEVVLGCLNGTPVGYALFFRTFSTFVGKPGLFLEDLFVRPHARGHGVGKRIFMWLARTALERGCGRLEWAVLDWNAPSIAFYRSLGAVAQDQWTTYRLTDEALDQLARGA
jgi:GNAT superfamily N-acetyltransferase